jgi:hypothetical protein
VTLQEMFNRSYLGVLSQGRQSRNFRDVCVYFTSPTCKCGIGWLLPDGVAQALDEINPLYGAPVNLPIVRDELDACGIPTDAETMVFLVKLQNAHDTLGGTSHYRETMRRIAANYSLTIPDA